MNRTPCENNKAQQKVTMFTTKVVGLIFQMHLGNFLYLENNIFSTVNSCISYKGCARMWESGWSRKYVM